ncbi:helix-turn-helix domain-containing protein [Flavivirga spongiicola]|uniref:Helix-turn-helix domain-containing protein n=1 Tax=Flavivirga spongiicola TaxID=421621 RepID=A0ABU7XW72_9FLAO|nr:helix-turn-helix domain-containing protein [Flavivirga sp. MEBiC05379]MDO5979185.1 helix-turn-helix domain-containing protein [Flavivirga sp. MEBiC05379]
MDKIQFIGTTPHQLADLVDEKVKKSLEKLKKELLHENANDELLTREQAAELLHINLSTLWHWQRKGKIKCYGISGSRRYYKRSEIMDALKIIKKIMLWIRPITKSILKDLKKLLKNMRLILQKN